MKNIALIGLGKMGVSHFAIANQTPGIRIKAICDSSKPLLRIIEKNTGFRGFTDYRKMLQEVELDAVLILVPNAHHFDIVKYCVEHRLHVFVEKPLTLSFEDSKYLVDLAEAKNVKGQVGYVNRFNPIFQRVKHLLSASVIGEVSNYRNNMIGGVVLKRNSKGWRNQYEKGGGCLYDYGPHCFDLATYFFGGNVSVCSASLQRVYSTRVDDVVSATLLHDGAILGLNYVNWSDHSVRKASNSIEINGSGGRIVANKQELNIYLLKANEQLALSDGWNQIFITDEDTDVPYYLRGEDFSRQLVEFSELINDRIDESSSSLLSASVTDKVISDVKISSQGLI